MNPSFEYVQNPRTAFRRMDGKGVLIVIDRQELHALNPVGARVWELAKDRSLPEIAEQIGKEFEVTPEQALADVREFIERLEALGAVNARPAIGEETSR